MASKDSNVLKITPRKKLPNRLAPTRPPPSRAQPVRPKQIKKITQINEGKEDDVVTRLQELVQERNAKIEQLTARVNELSNENKTLKRKIEHLQKTTDNGGVFGGISQGAAKNKLAGILGGHVKNKQLAQSKTNKQDKGGVLSAAKSQYTQIFEKYEKMMRFGINIHGAVGRMRQDGIEKAVIIAFEKKHNVNEDDDEKIDPLSFGLRPKTEVQVQKCIKMKRLHWNQVDIKKIKGSIWEYLDENTINYDKKHFELHFQVRHRKPVQEQQKSQIQLKGGYNVTFVAKKRAQAVLIGLKNVNLDNNQILIELQSMNEGIMTVETLSKLLDIVPTMDEQTEAEKQIMQEGTRRVKDYGVVEQFFFTLYDFYNLHQRLKLWMFKQNFYEICDSLLDQYKTVGKACDRILNNNNLKQLLTIILTFGNHMNSGTRKGKTYGFDLKILTQMTGIKSFDNTRSLLMYIYEFCDRKYPNCLKVIPQLMDTIKSASNMEMETLKKAHQKIQDNMQEIQNLITSDEIENYDINDRYIVVLTDFYNKTSPKIKTFNMTVGNVMVSTKRVMNKFSYGTDENPLTIESFFKIWCTFFHHFSQSKNKLIKLEKERQKRITMRRKLKHKERKKQMHQKYGDKAVSTGIPDVDETELNKGSSLYLEFEKKQKFDKKKAGLHGKLRGHVKQRSIFIQNGGKWDEKQPENDRMRRLSSIYQDQQEKGHKKAIIVDTTYNEQNRFRLPNINKQNQHKWGSTSFSNKIAPNAPPQPTYHSKQQKQQHAQQNANY